MMRFNLRSDYGEDEAIASRLDPYIGCNFWLEMDSLIVGGFSEVEGLDSEIELYEYREGGAIDYVHQFPTRTVYPTRLQLKKGVSQLDTLWQWYDEVSRGTVLRKNVTLLLLDGARSPIIGWTFMSAYPVAWHGPKLNAVASDIAIEQVELVHEGIRKLAMSGRQS